MDQNNGLIFPHYNLATQKKVWMIDLDEKQSNLLVQILAPVSLDRTSRVPVKSGKKRPQYHEPPF